MKSIRLCDNYEIAVKALCVRFGAKEHEVSECIDQLFALTPVKSSKDVEGIRRRHDTALFQPLLIPEKVQVNLPVFDAYSVLMGVDHPWLLPETAGSATAGSRKRIGRSDRDSENTHIHSLSSEYPSDDDFVLVRSRKAKRRITRTS
ncbi:hypothetical protein HPB50_010249 [Hyalomma asiaticum]|uniref:Uncharacterized protein n=1 Tax=Hyalomma asiaticum TaxID=266040 RepID=A0ACB7RP83_HYAAI|nr:hypothetical protein HPB50_010249 [Hyalomma asiaticum]